MKIFEKIRKFKLFSFKMDENDKNSLKKFISNLFLGLMVNFSLLIIFNSTFNYYSWIGYGFLVHLIENKLLTWIRSVIYKA
jgi:hypothetical protein